MIVFILKFGNFYYECLRSGVDFTTDINEAYCFNTHEEIENFLTSEVYSWVRGEVIEKMGEAPIEVVSIIKKSYLT